MVSQTQISKWYYIVETLMTMCKVKFRPILMILVSGSEARCPLGSQINIKILDFILGKIQYVGLFMSKNGPGWLFWPVPGTKIWLHSFEQLRKIGKSYNSLWWQGLDPMQFELHFLGLSNATLFFILFFCFPVGSNFDIVHIFFLLQYAFKTTSSIYYVDDHYVQFLEENYLIQFVLPPY